MSELRDVVSLFTKTDVTKYRLQVLKKQKQSNLCFSADLLDLPKLWDIIHQIGNQIVICKIHFDIVPEHLRLQYRNQMIELSIQYDFLVMEDRKFNDISYIVNYQYECLKNWVDMVTVHTLVSPDVIRQLSGVVLVANMSNNDYDFSERAAILANQHIHHVVGFVTQRRIHNAHHSLVCITPGISLMKQNIDDQQYRKSEDVDTDIKIVGRAIYTSNHVLEDVQKLLKN